MRGSAPYMRTACALHAPCMYTLHVQRMYTAYTPHVHSYATTPHPYTLHVRRTFTAYTYTYAYNIYAGRTPYIYRTCTAGRGAARDRRQRSGLLRLRRLLLHAGARVYAYAQCASLNARACAWHACIPRVPCDVHEHVL